MKAWPRLKCRAAFLYKCRVCTKPTNAIRCIKIYRCIAAACLAPLVRSTFSIPFFLKEATLRDSSFSCLQKTLPQGCRKKRSGGITAGI